MRVEANTNKFRNDIAVSILKEYHSDFALMTHCLMRKGVKFSKQQDMFPKSVLPPPLFFFGGKQNPEKTKPYRKAKKQTKKKKNE